MIERTKLFPSSVLLVGVALLVFTFVNAYLFLHEDLAILTSGEFIPLFGEALGQLVEVSSRVIYLAVMGWIGAILTNRGVQLLHDVTSPDPAPTPPSNSTVKPTKKSSPKSAKPKTGKDSTKQSTSA